MEIIIPDLVSKFLPKPPLFVEHFEPENWKNNTNKNNDENEANTQQED